MDTKRYDVGVIGAGPSGSWAAYLMATAGVRVLLADPSHPREKPCGGGVTGRALALVADAIGPDRLPAVPILTARFIDTALGVSATVPLDPHGEDLIVASRTTFDGRLLAAARGAGAAFTAARALDIGRSRGTFTLRMSDGRTYAVDRLVGADGANSLTRRRLAGAFRRDQLSIATGYFVSGFTASEVVIEFVRDPPGYIWSFPRPDHLAVGICAASVAGSTAGTLRARAAAWIRSSGVAPAGAALQAYAWPIPSLSALDLESLATAGPGWLLVGDAAGLVDPITREGIFFALKSAECASDAIVAGGPDPGRVFADRVRREIVAELIRAARLKARFFQPRFTRLLVGALAQSPAIGRVMADLVAGTQGYRGLRTRLVGTMEWRLALRLINVGWLPTA